MTKRYIELIDEQIVEHERAITKLVIAREVVVALGDALGDAKPVGTGKPKAATMKLKRILPKGKTRDKVRNAMVAINTKAKPKDIADEVIAGNPELTPKIVWNALYNMRIKGAVVRDEDGFYSLPPPDNGIGDQLKPGGIYEGAPQ
jgi:hypothetical protein